MNNKISLLEKTIQQQLVVNGLKPIMLREEVKGVQDGVLDI